MIFAHKHLKYFLLFIYFIKFSETRPEQCKIDNDCKNLDANAICSKLNSCKCPANKIISENGDKCISVSLFGEKCTQNVQCSGAVKGSGCIKGVCQCINESDRYLRGYCKELKDIGTACTVTEDCYFGYNRESVICDPQTKACSCASGYYLRNKNICRKLIDIRGVCLVDTDCKGDSIKCIDSTCGGKEPTKIEKFTNKTILASNPNVDLINITRTALKFGDQCTKNLEPCDNLENSICLENLCYCQLGYYLKNNRCMAELGEKAKSKAFCSTNFDVKTSICKCQENYFHEPDLRTCKKAIKITAGCTSDSQCSPYGAKCIEIDKKKKCICEAYAEYNEIKQVCVDKTGYEAPCGENKPCQLQYSICSSENLCKCEEYYFLSQGKCIPGIGAKCLKETDCVIKNSSCLIPPTEPNAPILNKTCICRDNFVHFNNTCIPIAKNVEDNCTQAQQCEAIAASCIENKCECKENEHFRYGRCELKRHLGEQCSRAGQCFSDENLYGIECRNSKCQCKYNYNLKDGFCFKTNSSNMLRESFLLGIVLIFILL